MTSSDLSQGPRVTVLQPLPPGSGPSPASSFSGSGMNSSVLLVPTVQADGTFTYAIHPQNQVKLRSPLKPCPIIPLISRPNQDQNHGKLNGAAKPRQPPMILPKYQTPPMQQASIQQMSLGNKIPAAQIESKLGHMEKNKSDHFINKGILAHKFFLYLKRKVKVKHVFITVSVMDMDGMLVTAGNNSRSTGHQNFSDGSSIPRSSMNFSDTSSVSRLPSFSPETCTISRIQSLSNFSAVTTIDTRVQSMSNFSNGGSVGSRAPTLGKFSNTFNLIEQDDADKPLENTVQVT